MASATTIYAIFSSQPAIAQFFAYCDPIYPNVHGENPGVYSDDLAMGVTIYEPRLYNKKSVKNCTRIVMAAPKKKTSKSKRDQRRATWNRKATLAAQKALSQGKSVLTGRSSFVYPSPEEDEE